MITETLMAEDGWIVQEKRMSPSIIVWPNPITLLTVQGPGQLRWEFSNFKGGADSWQSWDGRAKASIRHLISSDECPNRVKDILILYTIRDATAL